MAENINVDRPLIADSGSSASTGVANDIIISIVISAYFATRRCFVALLSFSLVLFVF